MIHYDANDDHGYQMGDVLEPGDVDKHGNHYASEPEYNAEMARQHKPHPYTCSECGKRNSFGSVVCADCDDNDIRDFGGHDDE